MDAKGRHDSLDRLVGRLAERQHGVVTRAQLSEIGVGRGAIERRLTKGRLCPVHRGVYTIGHRLLTQHGRWMAAVLACGPGAVLSHRAAAALWRIRGGTRIELTIPRGRKPRTGIALHWANLPTDETTTHHGIPTTTVPRTLLDLSAVVQRDELRSAVRQAEQLRLRDPLWLGDLTERYPRKPGIPTVRAVVEEAQRGLATVRSELEERFQALLINAGLPLPRTNILSPAHAFETDRARDRRLEAAGWRVIRITWRQLHDTPEEVVTDLLRLLGSTGEPAPARASPA